MSARRQLDRRRINSRFDLAQAAIDYERCEWLAAIILKVAHRRRHAFRVVIKTLVDGIRDDDRVSFRRQHDRIGVYRLRSFSRRRFTAREISDVNFFADRCEPQHRHALGIKRSDKGKRLAEHYLVGGLADCHFVKHSIRGRVKDADRALFRVEHETIAAAWSKPDRTPAGFSLQLRDYLPALFV